MSRIEQPENQNTETQQKKGVEEPPAFKEPPDSTLFMFKPDGSLSPDNRFLRFDHGGAASGARSDVEPTPLPDAEHAF